MSVWREDGRWLGFDVVNGISITGLGVGTGVDLSVDGNAEISHSNGDGEGCVVGASVIASMYSPD